MKALFATGATVGLAVGGLATAHTSEAATLGAGLSASAFGGFLGNEITPAGTRGYCADPSRSAPFGSTDGGVSTDSFTTDTGNTVTGDDVRKINYVLVRYGDTVDDTQAAAVNAYIYAYTGSNLGHGIVPGTHDEGTAYIDSGYAEVLAKYDQIWDDAEANWNAGSGSAGSGSLTFTTGANNSEGTVTANVTPANASGTITLKTGVFAATGTATATGVAAGQTLAVTGIPSDTDLTYRISGSGTFSAPGEQSPDSNITLFTTGSEQRLLAAGSTSTPATSFTVAGQDAADRSNLFAPAVSTSVASTVVAAGAKPQDHVTFRATSFTDSGGMTIDNPWARKQSGEYRIVTAAGTLYGPNPSPFTPSASVPAGVPVAGRASITTTAHDGPTIAYTATSDTAVTSAGYYTWVWTINAAAQDPDKTRSFLPAGYTFTDQFGQSTESHISPTQITVDTALSEKAVALGDTVTDTLTPRLTNGAWLQADGQNIPVTLTGTVYYSKEAPMQATVAPATATKIGTITTTINGTSPVESEPILVGAVAGYVTVQWSIVRAWQPTSLQGMTADWSDDYGIPSETTQVNPPTITTVAQPESAPLGIAHDTAAVSGLVPSTGIDISFAGYLQAADGASAVCDSSNRVFQSTAPVVATRPGDYSSEEFSTPADANGTVLWIETATIHGTTTLVHQGTCGQTGESTRVAQPTVVTTPPAGAHPGDTTHDTAVVDGWVNDGNRLRFLLYKQADGATALSCDLGNQIGAPLGPISLTPGMATATSYTSPETEQLQAGHYGFVEQVLDRSGNVLSTGGCHDELFTVSSPPAGLALTGLTPSASALLGGGLLGLGGMLGVMFWLRRRALAR